MKKNYRNFINKIVIILLKFVASLSVAASMSAPAMSGSPVPVAKQEQADRLDVKPTPTNSTALEFGFGKIVRVPKVIFRSEQPVGGEPEKINSLGMTFWYPDMVPSDWESDMDRIFDMDKPRPLYKDRFRVQIRTIYYSPTPAEEKVGEGNIIYPRPMQIRRNLYCRDSDNKNCLTASATRVVLPRLGLDAYFPKDYLEDHPEELATAEDKFPVYIEKKDSGYELNMYCKAWNCHADVLIEKNNFQYRIFFPSEAVWHAEELIRHVNGMIDSWQMK